MKFASYLAPKLFFLQAAKAKRLQDVIAATRLGNSACACKCAIAAPLVKSPMWLVYSAGSFHQYGHHEYDPFQSL